MASTSKSSCEFERYSQSLRHANKYFEFLNSRVDKKYESTDDYFKDLDSWLNHTYYFWNLTSKFPHYLAQQQVASRVNAQNARPKPSTSAPSTSGSQSTSSTQNVVYDGIECRIPALWKRIIAEFIDFLILFFLKMAITFVVVDFFDFADWDTLAVYLFTGSDKIGYNSVVKITQDIIILELVCRIVVCVYETYWLMAGKEGRIGGATPGKSVMGLRVLSCTVCDDLPNNSVSEPTVLIKPGGDPGLQSALMRSVSKYLMLMFFFPATFFLHCFRHNRTAYDIFSGTVVVEEPLIHHRVHQN